MKRIVAGLAVIVVSLSGFYLLMLGLVSADAARDRATSALEAWTGRQVSIGEDADVRLFPLPRLTLYNVRISGPEGDPAADILTAETLQADIRLLPLLIGRFSFGTLSLSGAEVRLIRDAEGRRNWRLDGGSAAVQLALSGELPIGHIVLKDATVSYEDVRGNQRESVLLPDFTLDWEGLRQPATMRGSVSFRDVQFVFDAHVASPLAFFDRKSTTLTMMLDGDRLTAEMSGEIADYKAFRFSGNLEASSPSLRRLIELFGGSVPAGRGFGAIAIAGDAEIKPDGLFVDQGQIELDGNPATGTLSVKFADRPVLSGTLAYQTLDLTPYLNMLGEADSGIWSDRRFDTDWFDDFEADLRLSADQIVVGPYGLGGTAASAILKNKRLEIGLAQAEFYGGVTSGSISVADLPRDAGQNLAVRLRATDFDLGQALGLAGGPPGLGGIATMNVDLRSEGLTLGQHLANLAGSASVVATDGAVPDIGLDVASQALAENTPLSGTVRGGTLAYQRLKIGGTADGRTLAFSDIIVTSEALSASLQGSFRLDAREIDLTGTIKAAQPADRQAAIEIRGPISAPMVTIRPSAQ